LRYQWRRNNVDILNATSATYTVTGQSTNEGVYAVVIQDDFDVTVSEVASLTLITRPTLVLHPVGTAAAEGGVVSFTTAAIGTTPMGYRWRKQGQNITTTNLPNGNPVVTPTNSTLIITALQLSNAVNYSVVASNLAGNSGASSNAGLVVVRPPASQVVPPGTNVLLRSIVGLPPTFTNRFQWQFNGTSIRAGTNTSTATVLLFTNDLLLTNVTEAQGGDYTFLYYNAVTATNTNSVVVTNLIGMPAAFTATLVVGSDRDGDGMPDQWELDHGLNPDNPNDASQDADLDGLTNLEEFRAGTDPRNAGSVLRIVQPEWLGGGQIQFQFLAISNRTYTVQYTDGLSPIAWQKLNDVPAHATNRVEVIVDPSPVDNRYYRIVTPSQP
jgi:hypothetical protein